MTDKNKHTQYPPLVPGKFYVRDHPEHPTKTISQYKTVQAQHGVVLMFKGDFRGWTSTLERNPAEYVATKLREVPALPES